MAVLPVKYSPSEQRYFWKSNKILTVEYKKNGFDINKRNKGIMMHTCDSCTIFMDIEWYNMIECLKNINPCLEKVLMWSRWPNNWNQLEYLEEYRLRKIECHLISRESYDGHDGYENITNK